MIMDWLTGRKEKEAQRRAEEEHEKTIRELDRKERQKSIDLWTIILSLEHYPEMSLDDLDSSSIESIYDIVNGRWIWELARDFVNADQRHNAYESSGETYYDITIYKPHDVGIRTIRFGRLSEGIEVIRGRFEIADRVIRTKRKPETEMKKERLKKLLEE